MKLIKNIGAKTSAQMSCTQCQTFHKGLNMYFNHNTIAFRRIFFIFLCKKHFLKTYSFKKNYIHPKK